MAHLITTQAPGVAATTLDDVRLEFGDLLADHHCKGRNIFKVTLGKGQSTCIVKVIIKVQPMVAFCFTEAVLKSPCPMVNSFSTSPRSFPSSNQIKVIVSGQPRMSLKGLMDRMIEFQRFPAITQIKMLIKNSRKLQMLAGILNFREK